MKTTFLTIRMEMARILMQMMMVTKELRSDDVSDEVAKLIGVMMCQVAKDARITLTIIDDPDVVRPVAGRCIFY